MPKKEEEIKEKPHLIVVHFKAYKKTKNKTRYAETGEGEFQGISDVYIEHWKAKLLGDNIVMTVRSE